MVKPTNMLGCAHDRIRRFRPQLTSRTRSTTTPFIWRGSVRTHTRNLYHCPSLISPVLLNDFRYDVRVKNTGMQSTDHEAAVIRAFVQRDKQERFLGFLSNPKNRRKFIESLSHFRWFDQTFAASIPWKVDPNPKLKSKGAGLTCWVMSEDSEIDGRELDLRAALEHVNGRQIGTILSCVPGKLAYFESEDETLLLTR